jgi:hypothetical protein
MLSDKNKEEQRSLITGSFSDRASLERAYDNLRQRGYSEKEIHLLMSDDTRKRHFSDTNKSELGNKALEGAGVGGATGGVIGATITAIAAAATTLAIPGLGLVIAGPLAGALAGGATGAAAGGLIGTLVGMGIPEDRAKRYEKDLKEGYIVIGVNPRNDEDATYFEREWESTGQNVRR